MDTSAETQGLGDDIRVAESTIVAEKQVMTVEQRVGRTTKNAKEKQ
jgi:hypothetical protein